MEQIAFGFAAATVEDTPDQAPDLDSYDHIIVAFSGGKDSAAALLHLLDLGVSREHIELWHHDVDGREGDRLMDWPVTPAYCRAFAEAFEIPIYFSWKVGGFEREMCRDDAPTAPIRFERPDGSVGCAGGKGPRNTRQIFPQVTASLSQRWCSAYCKIDVGASAIRNQERFRGKRTLFITGERGEESANRARYASLEAHKADCRDGRLKRHVDHWRPILAWREEEVWGILERYRVNPHPCYRLGFGRASCALCIFCSRNQVATARTILPQQFDRVSAYETRWGKTIQRKESIMQRADGGQVHTSARDPYLVELARSESFEEPIILTDGEWVLPAGAFGESVGPT